MTRDEYEALLDAQGGVCAVCGDPPKGEGTSTAMLNSDHNHESGARRGLLCSNCNTGLGLFKDDPDRLVAAAAYLIRHGSDEPSVAPL
jgi:hypothetical protein